LKENRRRLDLFLGAFFILHSLVNKYKKLALLPLERKVLEENNNQDKYEIRC
jgi:hypothetical protein